MLTRVRSILSALGAVALLSCGGSQPRDLTVTSFSPDHSIDYEVPIEVRFDRPVIEAGQVGSAVDPDTVSLEPSVPWAGHWQDRQTIVLEPSGKLVGAARYTVRLKGELARRAREISISFG
jgi:hypothetical protein